MDTETASDAWAFIHRHTQADSKYPTNRYMLKKHWNSMRKCAQTLHRDWVCHPAGADEHMRVEAYIFRQWICNRRILYTSDDPFKATGDDPKEMIFTSALWPWIVLARLYALRTVNGTLPSHLVQCERDWRAWCARFPKMRILRDKEGYLVCATAPYRQQPQDIQNVLNLFGKQWRCFNYDDVACIEPYMQMLMRRCLLFTVTAPDGLETTTNFAFECEMQMHALTYQCYLMSRFERKTFSQWAHFDAAAYEATCAQAAAWLHRKTRHGKFDCIGTAFRQQLEHKLILPAERQRLARSRAVPRDEIVTSEILQEKRPNDYMAMLNLLQHPLLDILQGRRGDWQAQQIIMMQLIELYLNSMRWRWKAIHVVEEGALFDHNVVHRLLNDNDSVAIVQLFNGFVIVHKPSPREAACFYACNHFIDVFAQFILLTRDTPIAHQFQKFYQCVDGKTSNVPSNGFEVLYDVGVATSTVPESAPADAARFSDSDIE